MKTKVKNKFMETELNVTCPNPLCKWHHKINLPKSSKAGAKEGPNEGSKSGAKEEKWFRRHGYYTTKQHEKIPRYICNNCHKTFTLRTGENFWHLKDDALDVKELGRQWVGGSSICEIAKTYGVSEQVISTRIRRYVEFAKTHWEYEI